MKNKIIFEAGSTKTTVLSLNPLDKLQEQTQSNEPIQISLSGYNPNRPSTAFVEELKHLSISAEDEIYFYGSGLNAKVNKDKVNQLFQVVFGVKARVFDDVLGAARATFKNEEGIVGILGTGGVVAHYNGTSIVDIKGGYGYLIDDIGGGYELGKVVISSWLNKSITPEFAIDIENYMSCKREDFVHAYYNNPNWGGQGEGLKLVAGVVPLLAKYQKKQPEQKIISAYFKLFYDRHVRPLSEGTTITNVRFIGSVAAAFEQFIRELMIENGLEMKGVVRYPAEKLWEFHFQNDVR